MSKDQDAQILQLYGDLSKHTLAEDYDKALKLSQKSKITLKISRGWQIVIFFHYRLLSTCLTLTPESIFSSTHQVNGAKSVTMQSCLFDTQFKV